MALCIDRRRRMSTQRTTKTTGSLGVADSQSLSRDYTTRDHIRPANRQPSNSDISTMRRCGCPFHSHDSFSSINRSSTLLSSSTTDHYAHSSATHIPFPPEVISASDWKRFQEAAILSDNGGSVVDRCIVGRDVTLDTSRDRRHPDIVT